MVIWKSNEVQAIVKDVLYVPGMKYKLLSFGQLVEKDFSVIMKN